MSGLKEPITLDAFDPEIFDTDTGVKISYEGISPMASIVTLAIPTASINNIFFMYIILLCFLINYSLLEIFTIAFAVIIGILLPQSTL